MNQAKDHGRYLQVGYSDCDDVSRKYTGIVANNGQRTLFVCNSNAISFYMYVCVPIYVLYVYVGLKCFSIWFCSFFMHSATFKRTILSEYFGYLSESVLFRFANFHGHLSRFVMPNG